MDEANALNMKSHVLKEESDGLASFVGVLPTLAPQYDKHFGLARDV